MPQQSESCMIWPSAPRGSRDHGTVLATQFFGGLSLWDSWYFLSSNLSHCLSFDLSRSIQSIFYRYRGFTLISSRGTFTYRFTLWFWEQCLTAVNAHKKLRQLKKLFWQNETTVPYRSEVAVNQ